MASVSRICNVVSLNGWFNPQRPQHTLAQLPQSPPSSNVKHFRHNRNSSRFQTFIHLLNTPLITPHSLGLFTRPDIHPSTGHASGHALFARRIHPSRHSSIYWTRLWLRPIP